MAATVPHTRGSSAGRKPTRGISSSIELAAAEALREGVAAAVESQLADRGVHAVADFPPGFQRYLEIEPLSITHRAIERYPSHDLGKRKVAPTASHFPDTFVRLLPDLFQVFDQLLLQRPPDPTGARPSVRPWQMASMSSPYTSS
jgi:hypothetical protein